MKNDDRKPRYPVQHVAYVTPYKNRIPLFAYSTFRPERDIPHAVSLYDPPADGEKS